ncbi:MULTISPECIES: hypothetical protein [Lysinibacillus]|uniref:SMI1/KNR4 family protein n=1 Tax=Lysinibacillus irui TaxID=2998077 RepID=A0AAJ5RLK4_9BACI|nr:MULTISPECIES: hypothetical protein [Lysinibacillus]WDV05493.1 hypothetical protein OU989_14415 [Lysinibacillus irui]
MTTYHITSDIFEYPNSYNKIVELNLVDFDLWYLMESGQATRRYFDLKERYPNRKLVPFARQDYNDDIACFEIGKGSRVQLIHDFTTEGFEQKHEFEDFWAWLEFAIKEMVFYNRSEEVE